MSKILIVVDYQTEFVTGKFGFFQAQKIEKNIADKISQYRNDSSTIAFTLDTHNDTNLFKFSSNAYSAKECVGKNHSWQLFGTVNRLCHEGDICFIKSTFGSWELFDFLREKGFDTIELVGVSADVCVLSNAVIAKTACPRSEIIVDRYCIASPDEKLFDSAVTIMKSMKITVI